MSDGTITRAQLRAAYDALGLPPDRFNMTGHIDMDPDRVVIDRLVIGDDHRPLFMRHEDGTGAWLTETIELEVIDESR